MPALGGFVGFKPDEEIPPLQGKVILVTGGTAGLGKQSIQALAKHDPEHIYFTGRNRKAAEAFIDETKVSSPNTSFTFLEMDFTSLASVKNGIANFSHDRLDILMCNAGVMAASPGLSKDGFETHFAINHLAHAMIIRSLLPILIKTAEAPGSDVRVVCTTSEGWRGHPSGGVNWDKVRTKTGGAAIWLPRYGQSKLANIVYAAELARRHPTITALSAHPGVVKTDLVNSLSFGDKAVLYLSNFFMGVTMVPPEKGCLNQLWTAAGAKKSDLVNGAMYYPIGVMSNKELDKTGKSEDFAKKLWAWTDKVLDAI